MPLWSRTLEVLIHEIAHALHRRKYGRGKYAAHGERYLAIYIELLGKHTKLNETILFQSAESAGLKFYSQQVL